MITVDILVPTGRGSYRRYVETTLEAILRSYDKCPAELRDESREAIIAEWRRAEDLVNAQKH